MNSVGVDVEDVESWGLMKLVGLGERNLFFLKFFLRVEFVFLMLDDDDVCFICFDGIYLFFFNIIVF